MDISSLTNAEVRAFSAEQSRYESQLYNFQATLEKMLELQTEAEKEEIKMACEEFESYFLQMMFREMRKTSFNEDGMFARSNAEKIFTDMMDEEVAKSAAKAGGIGLADMMYKQMVAHYQSNVRNPA